MIAIITNNLLDLKERPTKSYLSAFLSFSFGFWQLRKQTLREVQRFIQGFMVME